VTSHDDGDKTLILDETPFLEMLDTINCIDQVNKGKDATE